VPGLNSVQMYLSSVVVSYIAMKWNLRGPGSWRLYILMRDDFIGHEVRFSSKNIFDLGFNYVVPGEQS
jgi:hypothetical protein